MSGGRSPESSIAMPRLADQTPRVTMKDGTRSDVDHEAAQQADAGPRQRRQHEAENTEIEAGAAVENAHGEGERAHCHDAFDRQIDRPLQDDECRPDRQNKRNGGTVGDRPQVLDGGKAGRGEAEAEA